MINKVFIWSILSFLFGVFVGNILFDFSFIIVFLTLILAVLFLMMFIVNKYHLFIIIIGVGITFGSVFSGVNNYFISLKEDFIAHHHDISQKTYFQVQNLSKKSQNYLVYKVKLLEIGGNNSPEISGLLYYAKNYPLADGDVVAIQDKIQKIENFAPGFNYIRFSQIENIYFQSFPKNLEILENHPYTGWRKIIFLTKNEIISKTYSLYPKDTAVFLAGILLGVREDMDEKMASNFSRSGLTHLVAVSGFNITIIIIFLGFLFGFLPVVIRSIIILFSTIFFVLLVGDNIPVIRAGIMGMIGYFLLISGRRGDSFSILLFTAFVLILFAPLSLNYDASFHLSFLAVVGLLYFQQFWEKIFFFLPKFMAIKESFVLTMSAMTTTLPIMIFNFGIITFFAPIANMLVGGIIPFAMLFGFLSIILDYFSSSFSFVIGFIEYFLLKYVVEVAAVFGGQSFSVIEVDFGEFGIYLQVLYFMILAFGVIYFKQEEAKKLLIEGK